MKVNAQQFKPWFGHIVLLLIAFLIILSAQILAAITEFPTANAENRNPSSVRKQRENPWTYLQ